MYNPNSRASIYIKQTLTDLTGDRDNSMIIVWDSDILLSFFFLILLSIIDRSKDNQ